MVQRRPESADATMTMTKPARLKSVSPATSSPSPQLMMNTTAARFQLGLQVRRLVFRAMHGFGDHTANSRR